jgi:hypothetical protein
MAQPFVIPAHAGIQGLAHSLTSYTRHAERSRSMTSCTTPDIRWLLQHRLSTSPFLTPAGSALIFKPDGRDLFDKHDYHSSMKYGETAPSTPDIRSGGYHVATSDCISVTALDDMEGLHETNASISRLRVGARLFAVVNSFCLNRGTKQTVSRLSPENRGFCSKAV